MDRQYPEHGHVYLEVIEIAIKHGSYINYGGMCYVANSVQQLLDTEYPIKIDPILSYETSALEGFRLFLELPNDGSNHRTISKKFEAFERNAKKDFKSALPFFKSLMEFDAWLVDAVAACDDNRILKEMAEYPRLIYDALIFEEIDSELDAATIAEMVDQNTTSILIHINQAFLECYGWMPIPAALSSADVFGRRVPLLCAYTPPSCISDADNNAIIKFFQRGLTTFKMVGESFVEGKMDQIDIDDDDEWLAEVVTLVQRVKVQIGMNTIEK